jgi:hypothetical protein
MEEYRADLAVQILGYAQYYFGEELIEVNLELSLVPRPLTTIMIARLIPAAISPIRRLWHRSRQPNARMISFMIGSCAENINCR